MATIKNYTDVAQSRKLAEILPLESADMCWIQIYDENHMMSDNRVELIPFRFYSGIGVPCWSLAALLDVLESEINSEDGETYQLNIEKDGTWWYITYLERYDESNDIETKPTEELIDACYEMILKLKELNLL